MAEFHCSQERAKLIFGWSIAIALTAWFWSAAIGGFWSLFVDVLALSSILSYFEVADELWRFWRSTRPRVVFLSLAVCLSLNIGFIFAGWVFAHVSP